MCYVLGVSVSVHVSVDVGVSVVYQCNRVSVRACVVRWRDSVSR